MGRYEPRFLEDKKYVFCKDNFLKDMEHDEMNEKLKWAERLDGKFIQKINKRTNTGLIKTNKGTYSLEYEWCKEV